MAAGKVGKQAGILRISTQGMQHQNQLLAISQLECEFIRLIFIIPAGFHYQQHAKLGPQPSQAGYGCCYHQAVQGTEQNANGALFSADKHHHDTENQMHQLNCHTNADNNAADNHIAH